MWISAAQSNAVIWKRFHEAFIVTQQKQVISQGVFRSVHGDIRWAGCREAKTSLLWPQSLSGDILGLWVGNSWCSDKLICPPRYYPTATRTSHETQGEQRWLLCHLKTARDNFCLNLPTAQPCSPPSGRLQFIMIIDWGYVWRFEDNFVESHHLSFHLSVSSWDQTPVVRPATLGSQCPFLLSHLPSPGSQEA